MPLREQTHTADASTALPAANTVVSDATSSATKPDAPDAGSADAAKAEAKDAKSETKSGEVSAEAPTAAIANTEPATAEAPKAEEAKDKPAAIAATPAEPAVAPDVKKDTARPPGAVAKAEPPRRPGQIAVFVSRKDSKLYVRENFKPQFDVPITIAPSDRPLGTHVFTAETDKKDPNLLRWSVVSLPITVRNAARTDEDARSARRRKMASIAEAKPLPLTNSPAEALDRITVAPETMARIAEVLTTGSSIVVSDHGINQGGETGEGTDFIVPLR
jgi:hypothetical protein